MRFITFALLLCFFFACKQPAPNTDTEGRTVFEYNPSMLENATIYEANIRQYSPEGTFAEFTKDIPKLKSLGIDIIWLMPIHEIGMKERKGSLGSYYAVKDYRSVNPEFGNLDDFKSLLNTAHDNGMLVILDWVANHTAFDHAWTESNPEWYKKNDQGEIIPPVADWSDVAGLDYSQKPLHDAMIADLNYWVQDIGIDGYRCDVAGMVPGEFWKKAIKQLRSVKPVFMLAEAWEPDMHDYGFDMIYAWDGHHAMNKIAQGKKDVSEWDNYMAKVDTMYNKDGIIMNFTSNHDENSWNGTVEERMGASGETFAVMSYMTPGMPLIYSGQEYDMNHRLRFFEKDTIIKKAGKYYPLYEKLNALKAESKALHGGKQMGTYQRIKTSNDKAVLAFERSKDGEKVVFIANLSDKPQKASLEYEANLKDYMNGAEVDLAKDKVLELAPWQYHILQ